MTENDYSLLRPFDIEAAKRGEAICYVRNGSDRIFMTGPDSNGRLCVEDPSDGGFVLARVDQYRMKPLCWVEGKPVYKGDVLYQNTASLTGARVAVDGNEDGIKDDQGRWNGRCHLTWTPPKVKREGWVNVYPRPLEKLVASVSHAYASRDAADATAVCGRVACVRIEWEEPAC